LGRLKIILNSILIVIPVQLNNTDNNIRQRTDEIRKVKEIEWRHVKSEENPADIAFRGVTPEEKITRM